MSHNNRAVARKTAANNPQDLNSKSIPESARLKALLKDLDRPLDDENWNATPLPTGNKSSRKLVHRLRRHRQYRRDLKRARRAASQLYKSKPRRSARKRAALMMGTGALSLAAFTDPPTKSPVRAEYSMTVTPSADETTNERRDASKLTASDEFKQALIEEEGVRYTVYRDVAGYPTVGVGHLVLPKDRLRVGDRISEQRALRFLDQDLAIAEDGVRQLIGDLPLYQHEFDALVDLVFNVGLGNVSQKKSPRLNAAINAGDYDQIAEELDYRRAGGKFARGLKYRSERRANIFMDASYEDPREVDVSQG